MNRYSAIEMDDFAFILIVLLIIAILYALFSYLTYGSRNRLMIDRIDLTDLKKTVKEMFIVKRSFADGRIPFGTSRLSHWGLLLQTDDGDWFIIATQPNQITEIMKAYVESCLVYTIEQAKPWMVFEKMNVKRKGVTVEEYAQWITRKNRLEEMGLLKYSCQHSTRDLVNHFSSSRITVTNGLETLRSAIHELIHYKRTSLINNANCLQNDGTFKTFKL